MFEALLSLVSQLIPQVLAHLVSDSLIRWINKDE